MSKIGPKQAGSLLARLGLIVGDRDTAGQRDLGMLAWQ